MLEWEKEIASEWIVFIFPDKDVGILFFRNKIRQDERSKGKEMGKKGTYPSLYCIQYLLKGF